MQKYLRLMSDARYTHACICCSFFTMANEDGMLDMHAVARRQPHLAMYPREHSGEPCGAQVTLARVRRCPPSGPPGEEVAPGQWLLEVVARAAEGTPPAAARAIGAPHGQATGCELLRRH